MPSTRPRRATPSTGSTAARRSAPRLALSAVRPVITTSAPRASSAAAIAAPTPRVPPVTIATLSTSPDMPPPFPDPGNPRQFRSPRVSVQGRSRLSRPRLPLPLPGRYNSPMDITGKVALVTGGARRVGRSIALDLAEAGADVVVNYFRSAQEAERTVADIVALGRRAIAVRADVSLASDVDALVRRVADTFGRLDILVNSASTFESAPLLAIDEAAWDRVLGVNLKGPFLLTRAAVPLLRGHGGGVVINIADLSAFQPWPNYAHHSVSKAGLVHLPRVLARALGPDIRVNAIAPGTVLPPD